MVWDDVKKLGGLLFDQTREQKDIVLLKLRQVSYNNKKEDALARLGQAVFELVDKGEVSISADNSDVNRIVKEIHEIEEEIRKIEELVGNLKSQAATERDTMASEVSTVWEKTKTAFGTDATPPRADRPKAETKTKDAPKPPKQAKASTAKKGEEKKSGRNNKGSKKA